MRLALSCLLLTPVLLQSAETHVLKVTPQSICWGYYWANAKPALRIHSGDRVEIQTVSGNPARLEAAGVKPADMQPELKEIYEKVPASDKGPGGHLLTGPVYIEEAEPGDVLEVKVEKITLDVPYAYNGFGPTSGIFQEDYPYPRMKLIPLDREHMVARFAPGIEIPLKPFFGSMGIAPPGSAKLNSAPPWIHAGNMDLKELTEGSTLYIPVHQKGALFEAGGWPCRHGQWRDRRNRDGDVADRNVHLRRSQERPFALAARRNANQLHHHGLQRGSEQSHRFGRARDDRIPDERKAPVAG